MRLKTITLISFLYFAFSLQLNAQVELKINPLGAVLGSPDISAEFILNKRIGIEPIFILSTGSTKILGIKYNKTGLGGMLAAKYYLSPKKGADKFSIGVYGKYVNTNYKLDIFNNIGTETITNRLTVGGIVGKKFLIGKRIVLELAVGLGRTISSDNDGDAAFIADLLETFSFKFDTHVRLAAGYRFGSKNVN